MQDTFENKSNYYNTRSVPVFPSRNIKAVRYGLHTDHPLHGSKTLRSCTQKDETNCYSE